MKINDRQDISVAAKCNDIYRKFGVQFDYLLDNPIEVNDELYVPYDNDGFVNQINQFSNSISSQKKFFIGYTGIGKSIFLKHHFNIKNAAPSMYTKDTITIYSTWDGININDTTYENDIEKHIASDLLGVLRLLDSTNARFFPLNYEVEFLDYIEKTRQSIVPTITPEKSFEIISKHSDETKKQQAICRHILSRLCDEKPIEYASSAIRFFIERICQNIKRVIIIVDDLETFNEKKVAEIVTRFLKIFNCLQNTIERNSFVVNLLFSMRPHSFRYLKEMIVHEHLISYGVHLNSKQLVIEKDSIPAISEIFLRRFNFAIRRTQAPGNPTTWKEAYDELVKLVNNTKFTDILADICHCDLRAISECFMLIITNRMWCQDNEQPVEFPSIDATRYRFDSIVNVVRTLACGESSVYTGYRDSISNPDSLLNLQGRISFDNSKVFIPNLLIETGKTRECSVLALYVCLYLEYRNGSDENTPPDSEHISIREIMDVFSSQFKVNSERILQICRYLFENRIIRKSLIDSDSEKTKEILNEDNYVYFTRKGSQLLSMLSNDWIVNRKSDRFYKVRDLLNSAGDKYPSVPCKRMLLNQCT